MENLITLAIGGVTSKGQRHRRNTGQCRMQMETNEEECHPGDPEGVAVLRR